MKKALLTLALSFTMILNTNVTITAQAVTNVYIAPHEGEKYHFCSDCRGLRNAISIKKVTLKKAKQDGYTECKICFK